VRQTRPLAGCATVMALLIAGCGSGSAGGGNASASASASTASAASLISSATSAISSAASVHVKGKLLDNGKPLSLDLTLTRAGDMNGTMGEGGEDFTVLAKGGTVYLKVSAGALKAMSLPASACATFCGKYVKLSAADSKNFTSGMSWSKMFGGFMGKAPAGMTKAGTATINGQQALALRASDGTVYLAAQGTPYPLRLTPSGNLGPGQLDFTEWNTATIPPVPPASEVVDPAQLTS
jgi:hypothetical protein